MHERIPMSKAELARQLGVSRTYITLLAQGKRKPSKKIVDKLDALRLTSNPSGGINSVFGGFDSHALPPKLLNFSLFLLSLLVFV